MRWRYSRSAPAQKAGPSPLMTTTLTFASRAAARIALVSSATIVSSNALRFSGRLRVMTAFRSSCRERMWVKFMRRK